MKGFVHFSTFSLMLLFFSFVINAQEQMMEEESAEVFLEEYTDAFQEKFFEALKQKSIENYDRAINLLLECKQIDKTNTVVDHELAKAYLSEKQFILAQDYGIAAVVSEPENEWYLTTLVDILQKQGNNLEAVRNSIPFGNSKLKENLAVIYFKQKDYEEALNILKGMESSVFALDLSSKIRDSLNAKEKSIPKDVPPTTNMTDSNSPLAQYQTQLETLIANQDYSGLEELSAEAVDNFPVQPFFYYANGLALNKGLKHQEAILALETGLDFWLENDILLNKIYEELVLAYNALGNTSKANTYRNKIKSRL